MTMPTTAPKGIILAGGAGSRLDPLTRVVNKHLLPVYNKPLIYYSLSTLMWAGVRDVLLITTPEARDAFERLLGDGREFGIQIQYAVQRKPRGIAEAFLIADDVKFADRENPVVLMLGDNLFFGVGLGRKLSRVAEDDHLGATVFGYRVADPERYGVAEFDDKGRLVDILEKPENPPSQWAVTGLYVYSPNVYSIAETLKPSDRGELEITDVNRIYLKSGMLEMTKLGRGTAWLDTGTPQALLEAGQFVSTVERRQDLRVGDPVDVAQTLGYLKVVED